MKRLFALFALFVVGFTVAVGMAAWCALDLLTGPFHIVDAVALVGFVGIAAFMVYALRQVRRG